MGRRGYPGGANKVTLTAPVNDSSLVLNVTPVIGWTTGGLPFSVAINRGIPNGGFEEKVLCQAATGGVITVLQRGYDGTSKNAHGANETVEIVHTAIDD